MIFIWDGTDLIAKISGHDIRLIKIDSSLPKMRGQDTPIVNQDGRMFVPKLQDGFSINLAFRVKTEYDLQYLIDLFYEDGLTQHTLNYGLVAGVNYKAEVIDFNYTASNMDYTVTVNLYMNEKVVKNTADTTNP